MIDPEDPPRLRDAQGSTLGDALRAAERDVGSPAQLARLAARLGPALAPPLAIPSAAGMGGAAKLGLGFVGVLAVSGGIWLATSPPPPAPVPASAPALLSVPTKPSSEPPVVVAPVLSAPQHHSLPAPAPIAPKAADKPLAPAQLTEAELLEQARAALSSDPARALARVNSHAARYPGGALVQEREVIAIKALRQLGRGAEAEQRAAAFAKAFPGSAFARKLKPPP